MKCFGCFTSSLHIPDESRTALELFESYETQSFKANGFYAYDDFIKFAEFIGISKTISQNIIKEFISYQNQTIKLLDKSFLSDIAKKRYKKLHLDRIKALN